MVKKILIPLLILTLGITGCVSRKKTVLFQDGNKSMKYPSDKVQATFKPAEFNYNLKPGDVINIGIGSVTPVDFDFVKQYTQQMGEFLYLSPKTRKNGSLGTGSQMYTQTSASGTNGVYVDNQSSGFEVDNNGVISLPKIGDIVVKDKTVPEVEAILEEALKGFFETPKVRVQILNYQFTVLGEVANQGRYTTYKDRTTIVEALTMAGFFGEFADRANVKIVRTKNGETTVTYLNLLDDDVLSSQNMYVYPEDIIIVAPLKAKFWRQYVRAETTQAISLLTAALSLFVLIYSINKL